MLLLLALAFIFAHGMEYVAWPRLNPLTDVINYDGPGLRAKGKGRGVGLPGLGFSHKKGLGNAPGVAIKRSASKWVGEEIEMGTLARKRVD